VSNAQKFSFLAAWSNMAGTRIEDHTALEGRGLPCHVVEVKGAVVTVQFDILPGTAQFPEVTLPVAGFEYIRYPIRVGDKGVTATADVSLRGVSGLGTGLADLSRVPSLTALFFVPLGSADWSAADPEKITLYGPGGALIKTTDGQSSVTIDSDAIVLRVGGQTLELSAGGLRHNGVNIGETHTHDVKGVESGGSTKTSGVPE
jgi:hypothetical protein